MRGRVVACLSAGTQVRGIEIILRGRDPRDAWAFAQRICGVCTLCMGWPSVRAVEDALKLSRCHRTHELIRDLMAGSPLLQDHVMHFYHLTRSTGSTFHAPAADPGVQSRRRIRLSRNLGRLLASAQTRLKDLLTSGQLGIFANGWWGHPGYKLPPEVESYCACSTIWRRWRGSARSASCSTIFGGKNPHPNVAVGGAPCAFRPTAMPGGGDLSTAFVDLASASPIDRSMRSFVIDVICPT